MPGCARCRRTGSPSTWAPSSARARSASTRWAWHMGAPRPPSWTRCARPMRRAMEDGAFGARQRAHLPAGQLRDDRGADRDREGDGAVRRRLHHAHALGGRPACSRRSTRRSRIGTGGRRSGRDLPPEGGGQRTGKGGAGDREDRFGARGGAGCAGEHVSVHRRAGPVSRRACRRGPQADGKLFENLADPATRAKIRDRDAHPTSDWENLCQPRRRRRASWSSASRSRRIRQ